MAAININHKTETIVTENDGILTLGINGGLKIGNGVNVNASGNKGVLRFNDITDKLEISDGSNWIEAATLVLELDSSEIADGAIVNSKIANGEITEEKLEPTFASDLLRTSNNLSEFVDPSIVRDNLGLGTCAVYDVGTSANNVVQLDGDAKLPAIDGSQLTGIVSGMSYESSTVNVNAIKNTFYRISSTSARVVTLPDSTTLNGGEVIGVTRVSTGTVTIQRSGTDIIENGLTSFTLSTTGDGCLLYCDKNQLRWKVVYIPITNNPTKTITTNLTGNANSVPARQNTTAGSLTDVTLGASQLLGRGSSGNVAAISLSGGLSMSGTTLSASNGLVYLGSVTASAAAALNITSIFDNTTYIGYRIILPSITGSYSGGIPALMMEYSTNNGTTYEPLNCVMYGIIPASALTTPQAASVGVVAQAEPISGASSIVDITLTSSYLYYSATGKRKNVSAILWTIGDKSATNINAIRFWWGAGFGNITGTAYIYGFLK